MSLVKGKNLKMSLVDVSKAKTQDNGVKKVFVNYNGGRFNVQTPWMTVPWNMSLYDEGSYPKYSCELSFKGMETDPELQAFHDKFVELEERLIELGVENGVSWFKLEKKLCTPDILRSKITSIVKVSKDKETGEPDGKWPSTMKLKIPFWENKFDCKLFNKADGSQFSINSDDSDESMDNVIVKGAKMRCIIQCVGLWISAAGATCQWKLDRAEVDVPDSASSHNFLPDSDDEDGGDFEVMSSGPKMLDDSDEDEEPEEQAVVPEEVEASGGEESEEKPQTPEPAPKVAPKKIRRKVKKNG